MAEKTLKVLALLNAKSGKEEELGELLRGLLEPTRAEEGCLSYVLWQNRDEPGHYAVVEEWEDEAAFGAHLETDHMKHALSFVPVLLEGGPDIRKYDFLG